MSTKTLQLDSTIMKKFIDVEILETICENVTLTKDNMSYNFPDTIRKKDGWLYYIHRTVRDDSLDAISMWDNGYVSWENGWIIMTQTAVTDSYAKYKDVTVSIYRIQIVYRDNLLLNALRRTGEDTIASAEHSYAEGYKTRALGSDSHAEGRYSTIGHREFTVLSSDASSKSLMLKDVTGLSVNYKVDFEVNNVTARCIITSVDSSSNTITLDDFGFDDITSSDKVHLVCVTNPMAGDIDTSNSPAYMSHAEGYYTVVSGKASHAEGERTVAYGSRCHASGYHTIALNTQLAIGKFNDPKEMTNEYRTDGTIFTVGNGTSEATRSNAFRVTADGYCYGQNTFGASGADYAEMFEWQDGNPNNEDRRGKFVTLDGKKIKLATSSDTYILGAISANPVIVGDHDDAWKNMYKRDVFGQLIVEEQTTELGETVQVWVLNPEYDCTQRYIAREDRPEWGMVGMLGKLVVIDDGSCQVNSYCKVADGGIATASESGYRVMERIDETHVRILFR